MWQQNYELWVKFWCIHFLPWLYDISECYDLSSIDSNNIPLKRQNRNNKQQKRHLCGNSQCSKISSQLRYIVNQFDNTSIKLKKKKQNKNKKQKKTAIQTTSRWLHSPETIRWKIMLQVTWSSKRSKEDYLKQVRFKNKK